MDLMSATVLPQQQAMAFIESHVVDDKDKCALIDVVGRSELALNLATAYIRQNKRTISDYVTQFKKFSKTEECGKVIEMAKASEDDAKLYRTILFSLCSIKSFLSGKVGLLLYLCSYLDSHHIPLKVLEHEELLASKSKLVSSTKVLLTYKLISQGNDDKTTVNMDPVTQSAIRNYLFLFHNHEELEEDDGSQDLDLYDDVLRPLSNVLIQHCPDECTTPEEFSESHLFAPHMKSLGLNVWRQAQLISNQTKEIFVDLAEDVLDTCLVAMIQSRMFLPAREVSNVLLELKGIKYGTHDQEMTRTLANMGIVTYHNGDAMKAVAIFEKVLQMEEDHYGKDHIEVANTLDPYISALNDLSCYAKARDLARRAIKIKESECGKTSLSTAKSMSKLATALDGLGELEEAKKLFEEILDIVQKWSGLESIQTAEIMENFAQTLTSLGETKSTCSLVEKVLKIKHNYYPNNHTEVAHTLSNMAAAIQETDPPKAKELCQQALTIYQSHFGKISIQVARSLAEMGSILRTCGELRDAEKMYQESLQVKEKLLGSQHIEMASTMNNLSTVETQLGDRKYARILLEKAKRICELNGDSSQAVLGKVNDNLKQFQLK